MHFKLLKVLLKYKVLLVLIEIKLTTQIIIINIKKKHLLSMEVILILIDPF